MSESKGNNEEVEGITIITIAMIEVKSKVIMVIVITSGIMMKMET